MDFFYSYLVLAEIYVAVSLSTNLLVEIAGIFSVSQAAVFGVGAYIVAAFTMSETLPFLPALCVAAIGCIALNIVVTLPALRVAGDYFVVTSFGIQLLATAIFTNWTAGTGGANGLPGIPPPSLFGFEVGETRQYLVLTTVALALVCTAFWLINRAPFGRLLRAIREDELAVAAAGKDVLRAKVAAAALAGAFAGIAGGLYGSFLSFIDPSSFDLDASVLMLTMMVLGGARTLAGSIVGPFVLLALPQLLALVEIPTTIAAAMRQLIYGALLIAFMLFRPQGLGGKTMTAYLAVAGVNQRFGGLQALNDCNFSTTQGRITCLVGPNGAGKTTVFNVITGFLHPDTGHVTFRGRSLDGLRPQAIVRAGIARTFQNLRLFADLSALDNVLMAMPGHFGEEPVGAIFRPFHTHRQLRRKRSEAAEILAHVGLADRAGDFVRNLSYGEQKLLCIGRVLATGAELLLLDEPTSGLSGAALENVLELLRRLKAEGKSLLVVEHNTRVVQQIAEEVMFLHQGHLLAQGTPEAITGDPKLAEIYFGGAIHA